MKQLTPLKVLTLSALSLASFSAIAMEAAFAMEDYNKLTIESLSIIANLSDKKFKDVYTMTVSPNGEIESNVNLLLISINLANNFQKALCNLGQFINYDEAKKLSDSRLEGFTYAITVKAYESIDKSSLVCPNPRGKKDLLEKFKNIKEKECFYLTLKDFMNKKNWSQSHTVNSNVISNGKNVEHIIKTMGNNYLEKQDGADHFRTTMGENYTS